MNNHRQKEEKNDLKDLLIKLKYNHVKQIVIKRIYDDNKQY